MRSFLLGLAAFLSTTAAATPPLMGPPPPAPPPRLLIVIGVDQLSADLWDEYRPQFTGGLARIARGAVFRNGFQSHLATETCPGHATMLTGSRPARSGIVMNNWVDQSIARPDKEVYCAEDVLTAPAPGSAARYTVSAANLKVPTLGDLLKSLWPGARSVAVAGKDRAAVMLGGKNPDQRWYFGSTSFVTDQARGAEPQSVVRTNAAVARWLGAPRPPLDPPAYCAAKSRTYTAGAGKMVGNGRFARAAGDVRAFRSSPEYDAAILALAASLAHELQLGRDTAPDLLAIGLSGTDYVGHAYGTGGQEMCLQLLSLDRDLGDFFAVLDRQGIDYAVALTADHGGFDIPARVAGASYVDPALGAEQLGKRIGAELGLSGPVLLGDYAGDIYVDRRLSARDRVRARDAALAAYRASSQVEAIFTKEQLQQAALPGGSPEAWSLLDRARASFDPQRSGDLVVVLKRNIAPYPASMDLASTHGTPWDYDRRVPVIFWRPGMLNQQRDDPIETIDIMPTLAAMLGLGIDAKSIDGKCIGGLAGIVCRPR